MCKKVDNGQYINKEECTLQCLKYKKVNLETSILNYMQHNKNKNMLHIIIIYIIIRVIV